MVQPGHSPSTYEPTPRQVAGLSKASMYFSIGVPFEKAFLKRLQSLNPDLKIIPTEDGITKRSMKAAHECEDGCEHGKGTLDPHIWLDPVLVKAQAANIANALKVSFPDRADQFVANLESFLLELDKITDELKSVLAPLKGKTMLVFHPAFGYFADRFGLVQESIEIEGKEPTPRQLVKLIRKAKDEGVQVIFVQKQFSTKAAQTIADAINGKVVQIDPLEENYLQNLKSMAAMLDSSIIATSGNKK
jgi:zinc transport system substrate-binding protein